MYSAFEQVYKFGIIIISNIIIITDIIWVFYTQNMIPNRIK
jgi:hypothetical protein